ncbi:MAG TPA: NAD(P)-dependent oxidoreductase, partial [Candidatus Acidoferrales bacterium]|nr:NAD(P)-dependent oxidoreductase [Candidatus Acidoferrales bacterium]
MRIVVADKISPRGLELLGRSGWQVLTPSAADLPAALADADALVVRSATKVTAELLAAAPRLRVVGRAGAGVDNIDVDACTRRGILVMNTPGSNAVSVAEHAFALMLSLARLVPRLDASIHAGRWEKGGTMGSELRGKTLGLIGLGRVGFNVAHRAHSFEMHVLAFDPYVSPEVAREENVEMVALDDLLSRADCVSLHAALAPGTEKIINAATLAKMKPGAWLIN